jgi:hypothetical protein
VPHIDHRSAKRKNFIDRQAWRRSKPAPVFKNRSRLFCGTEHIFKRHLQFLIFSSELDGCNTCTAKDAGNN